MEILILNLIYFQKIACSNILMWSCWFESTVSKIICIAIGDEPDVGIL